MKLLFVIHYRPETNEFSEAITALLGVSLFGQHVAAAFVGDAAKATLKPTDAGEQLESLLDMGLVEAYAEIIDEGIQLKHPSITLMDNNALGNLISQAESVVSF